MKPFYESYPPQPLWTALDMSLITWLIFSSLLTGLSAVGYFMLA